MSLEFLGTRECGQPHEQIYSYIAMVEEFSKAGGRVGTHLNAVAPGKIECV